MMKEYSIQRKNSEQNAQKTWRRANKRHKKHGEVKNVNINLLLFKTLCNTEIIMIHDVLRSDLYRFFDHRPQIYAKITLNAARLRLKSPKNNVFSTKSLHSLTHF